jgi:hypothetical protein
LIQLYITEIVGGLDLIRSRVAQMFCDLLDCLEDALVDFSKVSLKLEDLKGCLG